MHCPSEITEIRSNSGSNHTFLVHHEQAEFYSRELRLNFPNSLTKQIRGIDELPSKIDGLLCWKAEDGLLEHVSEIGWIQTTSVGTDQLLPHLWSSHPGTAVSNIAGLNSDSVASFALTMVLAMHWNAPQIILNQQQRHWAVHAAKPLSDCTALILGLGRVGSRLAEHLSYLGLNVIGASRRPNDASINRWVSLEEIDSELPAADYVIVCLPLVPETKGLLDTARLSLMKAGANLLNVGRGGIVEETSLAELLEEGLIGQAVLDVFEVEPLPVDSPLWGTPGLIVSPHLAGERSDYREAVSKVWLENVARWIAKEPIRNLVTR